MDVGSLFGALTGSKTVKVDIQLTPPPLKRPHSSGTTDAGTVSSEPAAVPLRASPMTHVPSWRLHKNAFWRVKHPHATGSNTTAQVWQPHQAMNPSATARPVLYCYEASNVVEGLVILRTPMSNSGNNKGLEHLGITIQFIGRIDMGIGGGTHDSGRPHYDFVSVSKELAPPGVLYQSETVVPFRFKNVIQDDNDDDDKGGGLESYQGRNVAVRYFIQVKLERKFLPPVTQEHDLWVQVYGNPPNQNEAIKMEVGIEDCLHIEFEYERRHYHLDDTIKGTIRFLLVSIKLKHMELAVIRRETSGEGVAAAAAVSEGSKNTTAAMQANVDASNIYTETQTLVKYEIMDGAPVKGEVIPVKLCLQGIPADLTPTYTAVNNRFSVRYFLNLVLVDEDDRRYFKQQEIVLWRKESSS